MARDLEGKLADMLCEGKHYYVANFQVMENSGSFKATRHNFKLVLSPSTHVMESEYNIPKNPYSFISVVDVLKSKERDYAEHLIGTLFNYVLICFLIWSVLVYLGFLNNF